MGGHKLFGCWIVYCILHKYPHILKYQSILFGIVRLIVLLLFPFLDSLWMTFPSEGTRGRVLQPFHWGQCGFMVLYGMLPHGPLKMANIKLTIGTSHSWHSTPISRPAVAPPTLPLGAARSPPLHSSPEDWPDNKTGPWDGFKATIWCMTIAGTPRETIP